jgi:hypothetical protein
MPAARTAGRKGRPWRRARTKMRQDWGDRCHFCGHPGALEAHHVPPRWLLLKLGLDPNNPRYLRPAHGTSCPCPACPPGSKGEPRQCNQADGRGLPSRGHTSHAW